MTTTSTNRPRHLSVVSSFRGASENPNRSETLDRMTDPALWERVRAFAFDQPGTTLTFARRLSRENGWTTAHAARVIDEYRRFVYLAMVSPHTVSPSEDVDQAWHLHMVYTRSYWEDLCGKVLGRPLHHGPTRGGAREQTRFVDLYERTKTLYQAEFGSEPPVDLWPSSAKRFGEDLAWRRVNTREHWVIRKPRWRALSRSRQSSGAAVVGVVAAGLVMGGCAAVGLTSGQAMPQVTKGVLLIVGGLVLLVVLLTIASAVVKALSRRSAAATARPRRRRRRNGDTSDTGDSGFSYWPFWWWWGSDSSSSSDDGRHGVDADGSGSGGVDASDAGSESSGGGESGDGGGGGCGGGGCGGGGCGGGGGD